MHHLNSEILDEYSAVLANPNTNLLDFRGNFKCRFCERCFELVFVCVVFLLIRSVDVVRQLPPLIAFSVSVRVCLEIVTLRLRRREAMNSAAQPPTSTPYRCLSCINLQKFHPLCDFAQVLCVISTPKFPRIHDFKCDLSHRFTEDDFRSPIKYN